MGRKEVSLNLVGKKPQGIGAGALPLHFQALANSCRQAGALHWKYRNHYPRRFNALNHFAVELCLSILGSVTSVTVSGGSARQYSSMTALPLFPGLPEGIRRSSCADLQIATGCCFAAEAPPN